MGNKPVVRQGGALDASEGGRRRQATVQNDLSPHSFAEFDKATSAGGIAVFSEIKAPPFAAETELIEIKIVIPLRWSSELLERIEACIDEFGEEKGAGKTITRSEGAGSQ